MIEVQDKTDVYTTAFERCRNDPIRRGPEWLAAIRATAFDRFTKLGFPTTRDEEWRWTSVVKLAETAFEPVQDGRRSVTAADIEPFLFGGSDVDRLVFVDGWYARALSAPHAAPDGVTVCSLASAMGGPDGRRPAAESRDDGSGADCRRLVERHLTQYARYEDQAFTALNAAMMQDGALIHVGSGAVADRPIHVLHVSTRAEAPPATYPRNLIVVEASSQAFIVETYAALDGGSRFTNAVTELVVSDNAVVHHCKIVREGSQAYHLAALHVRQARDSTLTSHLFVMGGGLTRNDIHAVLDGEGGNCTLNGLAMLDGASHVDHHLCVEHAKPHCDSRQHFKNVLDGASRGVFSGRIIVHQDAQKTDAKQNNMSLLLSDRAQADSKPQLEIFADDVKCTHGATIGQIDRDAIFYLLSRGLSEPAARSLLIYAFARERIAYVEPETLRAHLEAMAFARLDAALLPREATS